MTTASSNGLQAEKPASSSDIQLPLVAADDISATTELPEAPTKVRCEQCGSPFEPRNGSGGRPQKFCSEQCRRSFHSLRTPTPPTPDVGNCVGPNQIPDEKPPIIRSPKSPPALDPLDDAKCIVIENQLRVSVYLGKDNDVIIAEDGQYGRDDSCRICIAKHNLDLLIDRLEDIRDDRWPPKPALKVVVTPPPPPKPRPEAERPQFDWQSDDDADAVVFRTQRATAIYTNSYDQIVIRQNDEADGDQYVIFDSDRIKPTVDKLCALAGIYGAGRK
jgi:hypothetical protein